MIKRQTFFDKAAISLSMLCTAHCLAVPVLLVLLPGLASLHLDNEAFHYWMVLAVLPVSLYALTLGCKQHKRPQLLMIGVCGLAFLLAPLVLHDLFLHDVSDHAMHAHEGLSHEAQAHKSFFGEHAEKIFTLIGAGLIALAHFRNYRLCRSSKGCCDALATQ